LIYEGNERTLRNTAKHWKPQFCQPGVNRVANYLPTGGS